MGAPVSERDVTVEVLGHLDADEVARVAVLVERATEADGVRPLSEHVALHLRHGGDAAARNLLLYLRGAPDAGHGPRLAGYAHLDVTDPVEGPSAELVVDPAHRRRGVGRLLVAHLRAESDGRALRLWSHGGLPPAAALAASLDFRTTRRLVQLRRSLFAALPPVVLPDGVTLRTFDPGRDDDEWLDLNARAFADHPEQGRWTADDLKRRITEPWFDPAGFFLAERAGRLVGFHWTKVHGGGGVTHQHAEDERLHTHDSHGHEPIGEVYVVGVAPEERGHGLGRALTIAGLRHLRALGLPQAMLYVDADNAAAIAVYARLGFTPWDTDVMFIG